MNQPIHTSPVGDEAGREIRLAHGSGGIMTRQLIEHIIGPRFSNPYLDRYEDSACFDLPPGRVAFTTDSFVVKPLFFPGGDIGTLAVAGTINDLAVQGARPLFLSCALVMEEGLPLADLERALDSMARTASQAEVEIVTGDTKVVERGGADRLFINTAGVGVIPPGRSLGVESIRPGDQVIISGTLGDHGIAVYSARENLGIDPAPESDCAPLHKLVEIALAAAPGIRFMRDPTRGGLSTVLNEICTGMDWGILLEESRIPVAEAVHAVCELLGFDPLYIANEGKLVMIVDPGQVESLLGALHGHPLGRQAAQIGSVDVRAPGRVAVRTKAGGARLLDMQVADQLPRIC